VKTGGVREGFIGEGLILLSDSRWHFLPKLVREGAPGQLDYLGVLQVGVLDGRVRVGR